MASDQNATVGGGVGNTASAEDATVAGGIHNTASGHASAVGGGSNNTGSGPYSTVPGGFYNDAQGWYSFAAGHRAKSTHSGSFVWADSQLGDFASTGDDQFRVRARGGVFFNSGSAGGNQTVSWAPGNASWGFSSDRNLKEGVKALDAQVVLEKVTRLPVSEWQFKGHAQRHIGPMAQDFHALFPLNTNDTTIDSGDLHGVALAAIQGLNQKVEEQAMELRQKQTEITELKRKFGELNELVRSLSHKLSQGDQ
jgi:hypothetical protein